MFPLRLKRGHFRLPPLQFLNLLLPRRFLAAAKLFLPLRQVLRRLSRPPPRNRLQCQGLRARLRARQRLRLPRRLLIRRRQHQPLRQRMLPAGQRMFPPLLVHPAAR